MTARPFATYTRAELLALYRDAPPGDERRQIMAELDLRKREAGAAPKPKKFAPGCRPFRPSDQVLRFRAKGGLRSKYFCSPLTKASATLFW